MWQRGGGAVYPWRWPSITKDCISSRMRSHTKWAIIETKYRVISYFNALKIGQMHSRVWIIVRGRYLTECQKLGIHIIGRYRLLSISEWVHAPKAVILVCLYCASRHFLLILTVTHALALILKIY